MSAGTEQEGEVRGVVSRTDTDEGRQLLAELHRQSSDPLTQETSPDAAEAYRNAEAIVRQALPGIEAHIRGDHVLCDEAWHGAVSDWLERPETADALAIELRRYAIDDVLDVDATAVAILAALSPKNGDRVSDRVSPEKG